MELCCLGVLSTGSGAAEDPKAREHGGLVPWRLLAAPPKRRRGGRAGYRQVAPPAPRRDERRLGAGTESVVHMLRSAAGPAEALELFKTAARQPTLVHTTESCNYMLELMRAHGRVADMAQVFDLMQRQIVKTNVGTFDIIFRGVGVEGGLRKASVALPVMREAGISLSPYTYNGLIYFLVKSGFDREAMEVYKAMADGIAPSVRTYSVLMVAFGKRRDVDSVLWLLSEMEARGVKPNVYSYTIFIRVLGQAGRFEEAYQILGKMEDAGCKPDVITHTVLIQVLCDAGRLRACLFQLLLASASQKPEAETNGSAVELAFEKLASEEMN